MWSSDSSEHDQQIHFSSPAEKKGRTFSPCANAEFDFNTGSCFALLQVLHIESVASNHNVPETVISTEFPDTCTVIHVLRASLVNVPWQRS